MVAAGIDSALSVPAGLDLVVPFTLSDGNGDPVIGLFSGSETFTATVWPGGGQPITCAASATWVTADLATALLTVLAAASAPVAPAIYRLRLAITRSGKTYLIHQGSLEFTDDPGAAAVLSAYTSYQRCRELAPWIDGCFDPTKHLAGFLRERATARETFDQLVLKMYRSPAIGMFGDMSAAALSWAGGGVRRTPLPSSMMITWLASNFLIVTPQVDKINAYLAIAEIGRQQIGVNNTFATYGQAFAEWASAEISVCTAQLDLNGDGIGEIPIPLWSTNPLFT